MFFDDADDTTTDGGMATDDGMAKDPMAKDPMMDDGMDDKKDDEAAM